MMNEDQLDFVNFVDHQPISVKHNTDIHPELMSGDFRVFVKKDKQKVFST